MPEKTYFEVIRQVLQKVEDTQKENIRKAAGLIADALATGKMLYTFGTGHSSLLAMEPFYRAGGFARVNPILKEDLLLNKNASQSSVKEREAGIGKKIIDSRKCTKGDVLLVMSNSGRNCVPVEAAIEAKSHEMKVIAITSMSHSIISRPRNPYNKRLFEVADVVIDNCGAKGDASLEDKETGIKFAPTSTAAGTVIIWEIVRIAICKMEEKGIRPELFMSANIDGGDEYNKALIEKYRFEVPSL